MEKKSIVLAPDEAREAICRDLRQYDPQPMLLCSIGATLCGDAAAILREAGDDGAWVRRPGEHTLRRLEGPQLVEFVCEKVISSDLDPGMLAAICGRTFQCRAEVVPEGPAGAAAIRIETGMEGFECRQCGHCCRSLNYRNGIRAEDVARWQAAGRDDILRWVGITVDDKGNHAYRMWVTPGTNLFAGTCPFLNKESGGQRWSCRIHDTTPSICRQYPLTRKHALMTGCLGFQI